MEMSASPRPSFTREAIRAITMELEMELAEREVEMEVVENIRNSAWFVLRILRTNQSQTSYLTDGSTFLPLRKEQSQVVLFSILLIVLGLASQLLRQVLIGHSRSTDST